MSDSSENKYVSEKFIHIYAMSPNGDVEQYVAVDNGLFTDNNIDNGSSIYKASEAICNVRLNERKQYELTFGNGFTGKIPPEDALIYVMYLDSNSPEIVIEPNEIEGKKLQHNRSLFGLSDNLYKAIFNIGDKDIDKQS